MEWMTRGHSCVDGKNRRRTFSSSPWPCVRARAPGSIDCFDCFAPHGKAKQLHQIWVNMYFVHSIFYFYFFLLSIIAYVEAGLFFVSTKPPQEHEQCKVVSAHLSARSRMRAHIAKSR